jgi:hypothetical protein
MHIANHIETVTFYVIKLAQKGIIGFSWLRMHNPDIDWSAVTVKFGS